ncbi:hypothetical protein MKA58_15690 [[Clostridium] innocuum]|nr:hypothetical protein [[Clostridium] innocuum]
MEELTFTVTAKSSKDKEAKLYLLSFFDSITETQRTKFMELIETLKLIMAPSEDESQKNKKQAT